LRGFGGEVWTAQGNILQEGAFKKKNRGGGEGVGTIGWRWKGYFEYRGRGEVVGKGDVFKHGGGSSSRRRLKKRAGGGGKGAPPKGKTADGGDKNGVLLR